ncbi:MAG: hypothetical protein HZA93_10460 [Verrucomicrobia bacterium]|nr:hypothetical protein [Verrucomicrobiota bacterium]
MNACTKPIFFTRHPILITAILGAVALPGLLVAQDARKNPASKIFVSDVSGEAQIDTGDNIQDLAKKSVYTVQGAVIETKKAEKEEDKSKMFSTMVYSNGTGAYFDQDTRLEMKRFQQEPFTPNRGDMEVEPSISQTQAFLARGTVALCNSKLVAGSSMNYQTNLGQVNIRGQKVVIESQNEITKVSMLDGESTVKSAGTDLGGRVLRSGEQAIIRRQPNAPPQVMIQKIPPSEASQLDDKVAQACMAKKTVYFEVKERQITENAPAAGTTETRSTATDEPATTGTTPGASPVTAFDGNTAAIGTSNVVREIIAVPVVPVELPVQFTVSPAQITTPGRGGD